MPRNILDFSDIVGRPYTGCWELVQHLYAERFAIYLPDRRKIVDDISDWIRVHQCRFGDVLVFREAAGKHVGFCVDGSRMIHATSRNGTTLENYGSVRWKDKWIATYRHRLLASPS